LEREKELIEEIIDGLVTRLLKRMSIAPENGGPSDSGETYNAFLVHLGYFLHKIFFQLAASYLSLLGSGLDP
jgi:hypothetical protein